MKKILCILFCLLPVLGGKAQTLYRDQVRIEKESITRNEDNNVLSIDMDIVMQENLKLSSNHVATLTPFLESNGRTKILPSIVVYGRKREVVNQRNNIAPSENTYSVIRRKHNKEQIINYHQQFQFEAWMRDAEMKLNIDVCGCCDLKEETSGELITRLNILPVQLQPAISYITPQAEAVKHRAIEGSAFLDFPVNQTTIQPDYRNNPAELAKIRKSIEAVRENRFATITSLSIKGYASPEGTYKGNAYLAEHRAEALLKYVKGLYDFGDAQLAVDFEPEDWAGLEKAVEAGNLPDKDELLAIIRADEPADWDAREWKLKTLNGGASYKILLRDVYPALRHSDYAVNYTIRNFTVDEAKGLIFSDPSQLSLNEMFRVAETYEPGSEAFNEVFEIAVRMYPDDPVSNLNAAVNAFQAGKTDAARRYLEKAQSCPERQLLEAALLMQEGKLDEAEALLKPLSETASVAAAVADNLKQIQLKRPE